MEEVGYCLQLNYEELEGTCIEKEKEIKKGLHKTLCYGENKEGMKVSVITNGSNCWTYWREFQLEADELRKRLTPKASGQNMIVPLIININYKLAWICYIIVTNSIPLLMLMLNHVHKPSPTHHYTKFIVVCPSVSNRRSAEQFDLETKTLYLWLWAIEARTRQSLWIPVRAAATGMNTSFLDGLYKHQATVDSYI